jgi:hypothetical protein
MEINCSTNRKVMNNIKKVTLDLMEMIKCYLQQKSGKYEKLKLIEGN